MIESGTGALGDEKHCVVCGRRFGWRRRWADRWSEIRHCSPRCTRRRLTPTDARLEAAILARLRQVPRHHGESLPEISPNEAARDLGRGWRALTERARDAARRLAARGELVFVQGGRTVDASSAKGPIAVRLAPARDS